MDYDELAFGLDEEAPDALLRSSRLRKSELVAGRLVLACAGRYVPDLDRAVFAGTDERGAVAKFHLCDRSAAKVCGKL